VFENLLGKEMTPPRLIPHNLTAEEDEMTPLHRIAALALILLVLAPSLILAQVSGICRLFGCS